MKYVLNGVQIRGTARRYHKQYARYFIHSFLGHFVDPTSLIKVRRISSWSRSLVYTFEQISITLGKVFSSPVSCSHLRRPCFLHIGTYPQLCYSMQETSDNCLKLLHSCRQFPEYLLTNENVPTDLLKLCNIMMIYLRRQLQLFFLVAPNFCDGAVL